MSKPKGHPPKELLGSLVTGTKTPPASDDAPRTYFEVEQRKLEELSKKNPAPSGVPRQPASSPWHHDPTGIEPPLGYAIDDLPPT
jgi:hypothetical protein